MNTSARVNLTPAWVLHTRAFQESSLILDVFTQQYGRLSVMARGVRGRRAMSKGSNRSLLQPFQPLLLSFTGKSEMKTLTQVESQSPALALHGDELLAGFYCNELLQRLVPVSEPMAELFQVYSGTLPALHEHWRLTIRRFELRLLDELGYSLDLTTERDGTTFIERDCRYEFEIEQGVRRVTSNTHSKLPQLDGATCLALSAGHVEQADLRQTARLMKYVLGYYLGPKPLKTRALWKALKPTSN